MYQVYKFSDGTFLTLYSRSPDFAQALVGSPQKLAAANSRRKRHSQWVVDHPKHYTDTEIANHKANLELTHVKQEVVFLPITELSEMQDDLEVLHALRAAGVDNWQGYDEAQTILRELRGED